MSYMNPTVEAAFETNIESYLLHNGYVPVPRTGFNRELALFPAVALDFIRETQPKEWGKLEALLGAKTEEQIITDLCKWMDTYGSLFRDDDAEQERRERAERLASALT